MAYATNVLLFLAKSLAASPKLIMEVRQQERSKSKSDLDHLAAEITGNKAQVQKNPKVDAILKEMSERQYRLIEHFKDADPLPLENGVVGESTRLIVLAHGAEDNSGKVRSDVVLQDSGQGVEQHQIDATKLSDWIGKLLNGQRVSRISLHICSAAKDGVNANGGKENSFALQLARKCEAYTGCVSARTGKVSMGKETGQRFVGGEYRSLNAKMLFTTGPTATSSLYSYADKLTRDELVKREVESYKSQANTAFLKSIE